MTTIVTNKSANNTSPAFDAFAISTSDTVDLPQGICVAIYIGAAGNVKLITGLGSTVTFVGLNAGTILPVTASRVFATLTTASSLVALY